MSDLTDFLLARIAEDEAVASELDPEMFGFDPARGPLSPEEEHINRHDPARVLAECEAKRRMIDLAFQCGAMVDGEWGDCHGAEEIRAGKCRDHGATEAMEHLRILSTVYADRPDYREEWRP